MAAIARLAMAPWGLARSPSLDLQATKAFSQSAELWGSLDWDPAGTTREESVDGSFAYKIGSGWQVDVGANLGLNRNTADVEFYGGVSVRFEGVGPNVRYGWNADVSCLSVRVSDLRVFLHRRQALQ